MDMHVKVLGAAYIVLGAIGLVAALVVTAVFGVFGVASLTAPHAAPGLRFIAIAGLAALTGALVLSLPAILIGWGLLTLRPWGWIAGLVLTALMLLHFPFGTMVAMYGLFVLLTDDAARLFGRVVTR
jgi:hypothetical protein